MHPSSPELRISKLILALLVLALATAGAAPAAAPPSPFGTTPTARLEAVSALEQVDGVTLAAPDRDWLAFDDEVRDQQGLPPRYAVVNEVAIHPESAGTWESIDGGRMLWRYRIQSPGSKSINLGFSRYFMPPGGQLMVYPALDALDTRGPFTAADNEEHGELWVPLVRSDDVIVEVTVPASRQKELDLLLGAINLGYRGFGTEAPESGSCNLDVECLDANDPWRSEMRSVANISTGGSTFCTGSLINNTANDHKMYFMTANHCGINSGNAASLVTFWNYENSFCRTPGSPQSGQPGDGQLTEFHTGSFFRAASAASDMTLVELDDPPVGAFNHFWAGWDRNPGNVICTGPVPCAGIHHPNNDEKRITYALTNMVPSSWGGTPPPTPGDGTHLWVHWATDPPGPFTVPGVTEPGSSGSPVYDADGQFVGQLHGGASACGATGDNLSDMYGRFSVSWTGGGTSSTRLSDWLDTGATGATAINGVDFCTAPGQPAIGTASAVAANTIQVTWADGVPPSTTFTIYRATGTCAAPGPFTALAGSLAGSPYSDTSVSGGTTYAYQVTGLEASGSCESAPSGCVEATATGACTLAPTFAGLATATNQGTASCGILLGWSAGSANCGGPVTYQVYRSTTSGFVPGPANLLANTGATSYGDTDPALVSGTTYYYVVRATDGTNAAQDANSVELGVAPTGPVSPLTLTETFEGPGGFDNPGWTHSAITGANDWVLSTAQSQTPTHSWFSDSLASVADRQLVSPTIAIQASSTLSFWHTFAFESAATCYDAGTLEISTNGGSTWSVLPDANFTAGGFNGTVNSSFSNPLGGLRAWCHGTIGAMTQVTANLASFVGQSNVKLRWHAGDDSSVEVTGWYVDSVTLANVGAAGICNESNTILLADFEVGNFSQWSLFVP